MNQKEKPYGLAILCDRHGNIRQILRDDLEIGQRITIGRPFISIVDRANRDKALNFLVEMRSNGAAFNWQINVPLMDNIATLHFAGALSSENILIVAAMDNNGVMTLYEEMMRINNEQVNQLRELVKTSAVITREQAKKDSRFYDDLTGLNNELSNLQRELVKKNKELERLDELKNRFLGMAAHDLRNPLGAIMMYAEFLEDEAADVLDETQMEFVTIIKSTSEFMLKMVNDLLDLAKIESGKLELEPVLADVVELAWKNVQLNKPIAHRKNIEIKFISEENYLGFVIDPGKISQVLQNLISNALKFSYPETTVEVHVSASRDNSLMISVKDQGQGIPEDQLDRLFKPFQKTSVQTTGGEESTGLGLAIVRKIIEGHGGKIWVESVVDVGSTFHILLPSQK